MRKIHDRPHVSTPKQATVWQLCPLFPLSSSSLTSCRRVPRNRTEGGYNGRRNGPGTTRPDPSSTYLAFLEARIVFAICGAPFFGNLIGECRFLQEGDFYRWYNGHPGKTAPRGKFAHWNPKTARFVATPRMHYCDLSPITPGRYYCDLSLVLLNKQKTPTPAQPRIRPPRFFEKLSGGPKLKMGGLHLCPRCSTPEMYKTYARSEQDSSPKERSDYA